MAGAAMSGAFGELLPQFERATGHKIIIQYGATGNFKSRSRPVRRSTSSSSVQTEWMIFIKQGKIAGDTRVDVARVGIGVAVREGAPKPDISSADAFKNTLLNAKSVTYTPESATTPHLLEVLDRLGIAEQIKAKTKPNPPNRVPEVVAAGEVDLAIGAGRNLLSAKGVQLVGLLPAELAELVREHSGHWFCCQRTRRRKVLIKHLTTPDAAAVIKAKGMEPLGR